MYEDDNRYAVSSPPLPELRDLFAMAAMQGLISNPEYGVSRADSEKYGGGDAVTARDAYLMADAMLKARKEQP